MKLKTFRINTYLEEDIEELDKAFNGWMKNRKDKIVIIDKQTKVSDTIAYVFIFYEEL